jgi:hypothetical protein
MAITIDNNLMNSLEALVTAGIKHFVDSNLELIISASRNQNADLNYFLTRCDTFLDDTLNYGTVEWMGDDVITGRYTMNFVFFMPENHYHSQLLLKHQNEMMEWIRSLNVEESDDLLRGSAEEFSAVIYHAYALSHTEKLIHIYCNIKNEALIRYGLIH